MAGGAAIATEREGDVLAHLIHKEKWYRNPRLLALNAWIVLLLITSSTNGYDGSMMNGLQSLVQWRTAFNHPDAKQLGLLNAIQNIGALAATPFAPYVTDGIGRKRAILLGAIIMIIGTVLQAASQSVAMFICARFWIGYGLTYAANAAPLLVTEIAYPSQRAVLTSIYNTLWYSGAIIAAWTTFGTFRLTNSSWSWRLPSLFMGLPSILQVLLIWFVPESPRWLICKGRDEEAIKILAYYHARSEVQDPLVQFEYAEIKKSIELDREVESSVGWKTLFATPGNRRRMRIIIALAFFSQWSGNGLVSYYLNAVFDTIGITSTNIQTLINGILQIWNFAVALYAGSLCEKAGRRKLFLISNVGMLIFFTMQTVTSAEYALKGSSAAAHAVIAFIFLYYASYDIAYTPLIVSYTVEILPYALRAKGFTIFNFCISLSLIFNQYANPIALGKLGWKYYIFYDCWLLFELIFVYFFIVETRHHTLEETAAIFDGEEALENIAHVADEKGIIGGRREGSVDEKVGLEKDEPVQHLSV